MLVFSAATVLAPLAALVMMAFTDADGAPTLAHLAAALSRPPWSVALANSLVQSLGVALATVAIAWPVAGWIAERREPVRTLALALVLLPFWSGFLARAVGWLVLLQRDGPLASLAPAVPSTAALWLTAVHALAPVAVLCLFAGRASADPDLTRAARGLGAGGPALLGRVTLPLAAPAIAAALVLTAAGMAGLFVSPALFAGPRDVGTAWLIVQAVLEFGQPARAAAAAMTLVVATMLALPWIDPARPADGRGPIVWLGRALARLPGLPPSAPIALAALAFLILPGAILPPTALDPSPFLGWPPSGVGMRWFVAVAHDAGWRGAALRSAVLATAAATIASLLATPAAAVLARAPPATRVVVMLPALLPLLLPRVAQALGLFRLAAEAGIAGQAWILAVAQASVALPFALLAALPAFAGLDPRLAQAARGLGAGPMTTYLKIVLPAVAPSLAAGWILGFVAAFDDLTFALMLGGGGVVTLPLKLWEATQHQLDPTVAVVALAIMTLLALPAALVACRRPHSRR
jgi:putative spermidine/putrescine transport system permease protein